MGHLLIADDIAISRETLARVLREAGHRVTAAKLGQEAIDRARTDAPDMAILDLSMPRLSGVQAAPAVKATCPGQLLPVLIVSGRVLSSAELQEVLTVADDFLRKPFVPAEICARVEVWLRTRRLFEEQRRGPGAAPAPPSSASGAAPAPAPSSDSAPVRMRSRAALCERAEEEWRRSQRWNEPFALLLLEWREPQGAAQAETLGALISRVAARVLRQADTLGMVGPGRAGVLLPSTAPAGALGVAERLRGELRTSTGSPPTVSMGLALVPNRDITRSEDLFRVAEMALERAAGAGSWGLCLHQHQGYLVRTP